MSPANAKMILPDYSNKTVEWEELQYVIEDARHLFRVQLRRWQRVDDKRPHHPYWETIINTFQLKLYSLNYSCNSLQVRYQLAIKNTWKQRRSHKIFSAFACKYLLSHSPRSCTGASIWFFSQFKCDVIPKKGCCTFISIWSRSHTRDFIVTILHFVKTLTV